MQNGKLKENTQRVGEGRRGRFVGRVCRIEEALLCPSFMGYRAWKVGNQTDEMIENYWDQKDGPNGD